MALTRSVLALAVVLLAPRAALAHIHLRSSSPAAGARLGAPPDALRLRFSEAVEIAVTTLTLTRGDGRIVPLAGPTVSPSDPVEVVAVIGRRLEPGHYSLKWRTTSRDGHAATGSVEFTVVAPETNPGGTGPAPIDSARIGPLAAGPSAHDSLLTAPTAASARPETTRLGVLSRWLMIAALLGIIGATAFRMFVVPRAFPAGDDARVGAQQLSAATGGLSAIALLAAAAGRLIVQRAALDGPSARAIVLQTGWGSAWLVQMLCAIALLFVFWRLMSDRGSWSLPTLLAIVLAFTPGLSGHAAAEEHSALAILVDGAHVLAAGGWVGGLALLVIVGLPLATASDATSGTVARLLRAFTPLALGAAGLGVVTGLTSAAMRLGAWQPLWDSRYGYILLVKLALVIAMWISGAINWKVAGPRAAAGGMTIRRTAAFELLLGGLIVLVTAVLIVTPIAGE